MEGLGQEGQNRSQQLRNRNPEEEADGDDGGDDKLSVENRTEESDEGLFPSNSLFGFSSSLPLANAAIWAVRFALSFVWL